MTIDPILALLVVALVGVGGFSVAKWWILRRPDPEVTALRRAAHLLAPYTQPETPEALAALRAKEELRLQTLAQFKKLAEQLK